MNNHLTCIAAFKALEEKRKDSVMLTAERTSLDYDAKRITHVSAIL